MPVRDLFSKRQKRLRGEPISDVYFYDRIPYALRVQIIKIWEDAFGTGNKHGSGRMAFTDIHDTLAREYGVPQLEKGISDDFEAVKYFLMNTDNVEHAIDVIELTFQFIDNVVREHAGTYCEYGHLIDEDIAELNVRFRENGVGYQYASGMIIRVDSQLIHTEIVLPALHLLADKMFAGANEEFLSAHSHYRAGRNKECLADCLKAIESVIKAICEKLHWMYDQRASAKQLIDVIFEHELISPFMQSHFTGIRATLESGIPTIRNRLGGHGQGAEPITVPESIATYALHLTAATIVFLVKAAEEIS